MSSGSRRARNRKCKRAKRVKEFLRTNKATAEEKHAKRRFTERFKKTLTQEDYNRIVYLIKQDKVKLIKRQSLRIELFELEVKSRLVIVVYDRKREKIVTFLNPKENI